MTRPLGLCALFAACVTTTILGPTTREQHGSKLFSGSLDDAIVLNDNGAWSWFEDERAVFDASAGSLLVSSVADAAGEGGPARDGNVELVAYHLATGTPTRTVLHAHLEADDHNSASLYVRPDGRYVAMYAKHGTDTLTRWRISATPGVAQGWQPERTLDHGSGVTYSNIYAANGVLHAFVRAAGGDPYLLLSKDQGATWQAEGRVLDGRGAPYVRYAVDHHGRIHLLTTEHHPREAPTSVFHGMIVEGRLLRSDGTVVDADLSDEFAVRPEQLTKVYGTAGTDRAWTVDLNVDQLGRPHAVFSVSTSASARASLGGTSARTNDYWYAWFDGAAWSSHFLAHAGNALYRNEPYYTGLVTLDTSDPRRVVVSTDVDPETGEPLVSSADGKQHHELFEGITADGGSTWQWQSITVDSTMDNLRPIIPISVGDHSALVWLRGSYFTYNDYDLEVVGVIVDRTS